MLVDRGIHGLFIAGTTGEGLLLTCEEREALAEAVLGAARGVPAVVHVGALTTAQAVELTGHAVRQGATAVAAIPPSYYAVTREDLLAYYREICRAAGPLPVYLYNNPSHIRNDLTPEIVTELRRALPNLAGIKESSGDPGRLADLIRSAGPGFDVICGSDELGLAAFQAGATGLVSSGAGIFPELYLTLYSAWQSGRAAEAEVAQGRIDAMQRVLGNGARLDWYKYAWALQGLPIGGVRPPLASPSPEEKETINRGLKALGLL
jgi:dihydrodipicolinate synthase/N-acetylneuraminate lyase